MRIPACVRTAITGVGWAVTGPDFDPATALYGRGMRHKDRASRFALRAAERALEDAGLLGASELDGAAVVLSSNFGNLDAVCDLMTTIATSSSSDISPMRVPNLGSQITAAWIALQHGMRGPNLTLCNGACGGLDAVAWACNMIAASRAASALVIGVEPDTPPVARLHAQAAGLKWIDGAVGLVIEPVRHAIGRGARIRAEISGYGKGDDERSALQAAGAASASQRLRSEPAARFGRCSGALGVVQCAIAAEQMDDDTMVAVAGTEAGESDGTSVSALVLTPPQGGPHDP